MEPRRQWVFTSKGEATAFADWIKASYRPASGSVRVRRSLPRPGQLSVGGRFSVFYRPASFGELIEIAPKAREMGGMPANQAPGPWKAEISS